MRQDAGKTVEWSRKAAEQGNANAQCSLGMCYGRGEGVRKDTEKAVEWWRKAAGVAGMTSCQQLVDANVPGRRRHRVSGHISSSYL